MESRGSKYSTDLLKGLGRSEQAKPAAKLKSRDKFIYLLKDFIHSFPEKEGKEKERERNINVWLPSERPQLETWPTTQACVPTGNQTSDPLVHSPVLNPLSHSNQGSRDEVMMVVMMEFEIRNKEKLDQARKGKGERGRKL